MSSRVAIVSADGHVGCPPGGYRDYIDPEYRHLLDELGEEQQVATSMMGVLHQIPADSVEVVDPRGIRQGQPWEVGWDLSRRLTELDKEGIAAEFVINGSGDAVPFFSWANKPRPADVRSAGARAYNRWVADLVTDSKGRLFANAEVDQRTDRETSTRELKWIAEHGFVSVTVPGIVHDPSHPPLCSREYDWFWAACADLNLNLNLHAGWGMAQGLPFEGMKAAMTGMLSLENFDFSEADEQLKALDGDNVDSPFALDMGPRQAMWQLMLGGVFDRYPSLTLVLTEVRADWLPPTLAYLDRRFAEHKAPVALSPSEYFARNCVATPSAPHRAEIAMRHQIGVDRLLFGADLPHPESTWPNTREWIRDVMQGVPQEEAQKILSGNAIRVYGLDADAIDRVAQRIGPRPEEIFGESHLDDRLIAHFHQRAGYEKPAETVDVGKIQERLATDFTAVRQR
ncbi:amidohydrolase family protein [Mycobacterium colombiense]|uniref:amidohydrolase family protein n=1 Tax=Mycobacterium colombiense TaxID=339268 RepID=UPI0009E1DFAA|nr:amidohydrolase family protein [Mycobacterium colombiense]